MSLVTKWDAHVLEVLVWAGDSYRPASGADVVGVVTQALTEAGITASVRWERMTPAALS